MRSCLYIARAPVTVLGARTSASKHKSREVESQTDAPLPYPSRPLAMQGGTRAHACIQMPKHESSGQAPNPCCFLLFLPLVVISISISIVDIYMAVVKHACIQMPKHESSGQAPTPCCFLLFLPLVVILTSISIVDTLLVVKHACMHMRWHESNGQDSTPCCFLLFLPLVVI